MDNENNQVSIKIPIDHHKNRFIYAPITQINLKKKTFN